jgi:phage tail-like protein
MVYGTEMTQEFTYRLHVEGPEESRFFQIPVGTTTIGRQEGSDLELIHEHVSRQHARLVCTNTECQIVDQRSSNGTRLNGQRLKPHTPEQLDHNAVIRIGPYKLAVEKIPLSSPRHLEVQPAVPLLGPAKVQKAPVRPEVDLPPLEIEPAAELAVDQTERAASPWPPFTGPPARPEPPSNGDERPLPDHSSNGHHLLSYLPDIYRTRFMARFLGIFESVMMPIEWNVDNFDLFLDPRTTLTGFLPWLSNWFGITFDPTWSEAQRRVLLAEAHRLYARRGTRWALSRVLEIYTGCKPEIVDAEEGQAPHTFRVRLSVCGSLERTVHGNLIEAIIDAHKPAHTSYTLEFGE